MKELREDRRPADLWYWSDWFSSVDLRSCSLAARGLWADMLGIMSRADRKGFLSINGQPMGSKELAKFVGEFKDKVEELLQELEYYRVFSRDEEGTIYNRRMVRETDLSKKRAEAGRKGGLSKQKPSKVKAKVASKPQASVENEDEDEDSSSSLITKEKVSDQTDVYLVQLLIDLMLQNNPESSILKRLTPTRQNDWINQCRLLREADGRTPEQIEAVIRFCQTDSFWKSNILSMPKLREKWDTLWMKAKLSDPHAGLKEWLADQEKKDAGKK